MPFLYFFWAAKGHFDGPSSKSIGSNLFFPNTLISSRLSKYSDFPTVCNHGSEYIPVAVVFSAVLSVSISGESPPQQPPEPPWPKPLTVFQQVNSLRNFQLLYIYEFTLNLYWKMIFLCSRANLYEFESLSGWKGAIFTLIFFSTRLVLFLLKCLET